MRPPGDPERLSDAIGRIYDAAATPSLWAQALDGVNALLGAQACQFVGWDVQQRRVEFDICANISPSAIAAYESHYMTLSPLRQAAEDLPAGRIFRCHDVHDDAFVARSEFYNDYRLPLVGTRYAMTTALERSAGRIVVLGFHRAPEPGPFGDEQARLLTWLTPHVKCLVDLQRLLQRSQAHVIGLERAVEGFDVPLALLDRSGRVVFANSAMEAIQRNRDGLVIAKGVLTCTRPSDAPHLRKALSSALSLARREPTRDASARPLTLRRADRPALVVHAVPLRLNQAFPSEPGDPHVLVVASERGRKPVDVTDLLRAAFGLTAAEAHLAARIASGADLAAIAEEKGVSLTTVRSQLGAVFAKTGVSRQAVLVRLVSELAVWRG